MSVSAISSASLPAIPAEIQKPTAAPVASSQSPAQLPTDTVSLSSAAMKATGGDADHDGDSH
jgi:hypothetical protein